MLTKAILLVIYSLIGQIKSLSRNNNSIIINIDINDKCTTEINHFWKNTGFCPPDPKEKISEYLLSYEQQLNLALTGSLPNNGIEHVRIHWLLNLITSTEFGNQLHYNFTNLDTFLYILHKNGLFPRFEIMGAPSRLVKFKKSKKFWMDFMHQISLRYLEIFGTNTVAKWRFETWNEPDLLGYNSLNFSLPEFIDYVLGSNEGLKSSFAIYNLTYSFGGPAGLFRDKNHPLCWGLLEFCSLSIDDCPLKYFSFHRKGKGSVEGVLNGSLSLIHEVFELFPKLRRLPVSNDEADIESNWSQSREWRGDVRYALMIVKVIAGFYKTVKLESKLDIEMLSNDNGFLNYHPYYFTQRTLFARFQINSTTPHHCQFIKKPVYSLMALLSFLGEIWIPAVTSPTFPELDPLLTTIATRSTQYKQPFVSVILAYGNETYEDLLQENSKKVTIKLQGLENNTSWRYLIYKLDNLESNPYKLWKQMGSPVFPSVNQRSQLRAVENPKKVVGPIDINNESLNMELVLDVPSIHLIQICSKGKLIPLEVLYVSAYNITWNEVLLTWKYPYENSRCLQRYEVEFQAECSGSSPSSSPHFKGINPLDTTIFMSFHHVGEGGNELCEGTRGTYRVRAVDYWDRVGPYSEVMPYP